MPSSLTTVGAVLKGIVSGKSIQTLERPVQGDEFGILKVSAVTWGAFRPAENKALPAGYDPKDCPRPMDGDILISRANTRELVGAPVMVQGNHPQLLLSDKLLKLIPDETVIDARYLVRALRSPSASAHFYKSAGGSSGSMTNITQSDIRTAPIYLPPLPQQRRIAAILDQAETLRTQRRTALAQLDSLTQSIFLDMFGDPDKNSKGWTMGKIGDMLESASYGTSEKSGAEGEFPVLRMNNLTRTGELDLQNLKYMDLPSKDYDRYLVKAGDVLFNRTNSAELVGKTTIIPPSTPPLAYAGYLVRLRVSDAHHPLYLVRFMNTSYAKRMLRSMCKSIVGMANINAKEIQAMRIALPPLPLQQTFATRIQAIEALKATHRAALTQLDALFAALQQRAFAGQL